jgi:hypothetical protein
MKIERDGAGVVLSLEEIEFHLLRDLVDQLVTLATPDVDSDKQEDELAILVGIDSGASKPTDPVLTRLYPDAYPEDPEASLEFRRFTERSLRTASIDRAARVRASLVSQQDISLDLEGWADWVGLINDLRLALGTRLDISESLEESEMAANDPRAPLFDLYGWLTWMQDTLINEGYFHED